VRTFFKIIVFSLNPKKIEMILLLTAEYSLKTNTEEINMTQTQEQINQNCVETNSSYAFKTTNPDCKETKLFDLVRSGTHTAIDLIAAERYDALEWYKARASYLEKRVAELEEKYEKKDEDEDEDSDDEEEGYTEEDTIAEFNKEADKCGATAEQRERGVAMLKTAFEDEDPARKAMTMARDAITRVVKEHEELKRQHEELKRKVLLLQEAGYYHRHTFTQGDINTDDAAFDHYWSVQDNDLTLWKVPRHLADVPSAQTSYHGAVEQAFYDECFGEEYGKLKWMRVREMTQEDLVRLGWQPKDDAEKYTVCDECGRFCYTGGDKHPDGYVCADCDEDEE
jgi:hypothetical protein